jgi:hypothetical protein
MLDSLNLFVCWSSQPQVFMRCSCNETSRVSLAEKLRDLFLKKTKLQDCLLIYWSTWLKFLYVALAMKLREFRCNTEKLRDLFKKKRNFEIVYLFTGVRLLIYWSTWRLHPENFAKHKLLCPSSNSCHCHADNIVGVFCIGTNGRTTLKICIYGVDKNFVQISLHGANRPQPRS